MKVTIIFLILFVFMSFGCEKDDVSGNSENIKLIVNEKVYLDTYNNEIISDPFEIDNVVKENNILHVDVKYGGGCKEHQFGVIWDGNVIEAVSPTIYILLVHDANNDMCEAYLSDRISVDLKDLMDDDYVNEINIVVVNGYSHNEY